MTKAVQHHDSTCLAEGLDKLTTLAELLELDIKDSFVTLDPGFDSEGAEE